VAPLRALVVSLRFGGAAVWRSFHQAPEKVAATVSVAVRGKRQTVPTSRRFTVNQVKPFFSCLKFHDTIASQPLTMALAMCWQSSMLFSYLYSTTTTPSRQGAPPLPGALQNLW
jgi:hypothetical protein